MASEANAKGNSRRSAAEDKRRREWESVRVLDGASAPKHTGLDRHDSRVAKRKQHAVAAKTDRGGAGGALALDDPAALGAVSIALGLLHARLKAQGMMDKRGAEVRAMADPFIPLLTRYERHEV